MGWLIYVAAVVVWWWWSRPDLRIYDDIADRKCTGDPYTCLRNWHCTYGTCPKDGTP